MVLLASLLVSSWGPGCARAAAAVIESGAVKQPLLPAWTAALQGFTAWSAGPAARAEIAGVDPALANLAPGSDAGLAAAEPLLRQALAAYPTEDGKKRFLERLAGAAALAVEDRAALLAELSKARSAALAEHGAAKALAVARQPLDFDAVRSRLDAQDLPAAQKTLTHASPVDLAAGWQKLSPAQRKLAFRLLPGRRARQTFEELEPHHQRELLESLEHEHFEDLVRGLDPRVVGQVARELPANLVRRLLDIANKGDRESIQRYSEYPEKTVGALMRGRYVTLEPQWTAQHALERVRLSTRLSRVEEDHLDTPLVVDADQKLLGLVSLKALVAAPAGMRVGELMDAAPRVLSPQMHQEEAVQIFTRYKLKNAPVVDGAGKVLGLVVPADVLGAAKEETDEDFAKISGGGQLLAKSPLAITRMRLPWLIATAAGELLVSLLVRHFEPTLAHVVALATFIPLISAMGGNVGSQTATVVVRGLATGEVAAAGAHRVVVKEITVGMMLGLVYGAFIGVAALAMYGTQYGLWLPIVVGAAMAVSMTAAATAGSLEPFLFKKLGIDPATATGPLITTFTDLLSTVVYFSLATALLLR